MLAGGSRFVTYKSLIPTLHSQMLWLWKSLQHIELSDAVLYAAGRPWEDSCMAVALNQTQLVLRDQKNRPNKGWLGVKMFRRLDWTSMPNFTTKPLLSGTWWEPMNESVAAPKSIRTTVTHCASVQHQIRNKMSSTSGVMVSGPQHVNSSQCDWFYTEERHISGDSRG